MPGFSEEGPCVGGSTYECGGVDPVEVLLLAELLAADVLLVGAARVEHLEGRLLHQVGLDGFGGVLSQVLETGHSIHSGYADLFSGGDVGTGSVLYLEALDSELLPVGSTLGEARQRAIWVGTVVSEDVGGCGTRYV